MALSQNVRPGTLPVGTCDLSGPTGGEENNGCVVLAPGERVDELIERRGIWNEARVEAFITHRAPGRDVGGNPVREKQTYGEGVVGLYADRSQRHTGGWRGYPPGGHAYARGARVQTAETLGGPVPIGRRTDVHYATLYPQRRPDYRRFRGGLTGMQIQGGQTSPRERGWALTVERARASVRFPRFGTTKRVFVAALAAFVLMIGAVGTSFAEQYRYEVQDGDTVESVAATFGVDPQAIVQSSYIPDGETLTPGQVIVIPEQGQSPADAAQMAAAREGTSPWVQSAHWVEEGESLESIAADYGLDAQALADFNGISDPTSITPGQRIVIPPSRDGAETQQSAQEATSSHAADVVVPGVPTYAQTRNLSCEYAAVHIATATFGGGIPEDVMISSIPVTLNPHYGYRGNIDGPWGNTTDYGIYPEALAPTVNDWGFQADIFYGQGDTSQLKAEIDAGHPVLVWLGMWGDTRERLSDDGDYSVAAGMHVVVAYGYDDDGLYVSDPAHGNYDFYSWDAFMGMWNVLDGMSMAVYPA